MSGEALGGLGRTVLSGAGVLVMSGLLAVTLVRTPLGAWLSVAEPPRPVAGSVSTAGFDAALLGALAGRVAPEAATRPWRLDVGGLALPIAVPNQHASRWCWAATAAAVAAYYGRDVTQCAVVATGSPWGRVTGGCPDVPGTAGDQVRALAEAGVPAHVVERALTSVELAAQISAGRPVLVHLSSMTGAGLGHVVLVRGLDASGALLVANPAGDRPEAALAWSSPATWGVPYDALVLATASSPPVSMGRGEDHTDRFEVPGRWTLTVIVAEPGGAPSVRPAPTPVWTGGR